VIADRPALMLRIAGRSRIRRRALPALAVATALLLATGMTATAATAIPAKTTKTTPAKITPAKPRTPVRSTGVENWTAPSSIFQGGNPHTQLTVVRTPGALDGSALRLQLKARPDPGPSGGSLISSSKLYQYGSFGTRMKTADCTGQDHPGVVTGTFTYAGDHSDANHNGVSDNDEIDIEVLCGQPDVVYLSIWTDYSETVDAIREITRAVDLRTGRVLSTCYLVSYSTGCGPILAGENSPAGIAPIPGFNSATQFHSYSFDWQPDHVTFRAGDNAGTAVVLWDYRGPRSRIPSKPSSMMQNVTYTPTWNPLNGPSHNQPTVNTSAYIDSTFAPAG
jgi:beta-glucanase (GH16 family)